jgi:uncharacterized protein YndB with AHSA1/START domain
VIRFERTYAIARPPAAVFEVLTDPARLAEWQEGTVEVEQLTPEPIGLGSRLREVHSAMGRKLESVVEVTEFEPDRVFALHVVEGVPVDGRWELAADGDGTRVTFTVTGDPPGPAPVIAFILKRQFDAHHRRLKKLVES